MLFRSEVRVVPRQEGPARLNGRGGDPPVVIIESPRSRETASRVLASVAPDAYVVMAPRPSLRLTLGKIAELIAVLRNRPEPRGPRTHSSLEAFVEETVKALVKKKMKHSEGRTLHAMLIQELERPLITLVLKETRGNQSRAARLLGVNRNTLRKKITDLKIDRKSVV